MISSYKQISKAATICLLGLAATACRSQTPPQLQQQRPTQTALLPQSSSPTAPKAIPAVYRNLIALDPAHGGSDPGAHLSANANEKDVTLAFAARLRPLLIAAGFTVISTHDADTDLTTDQRAGIANHARPAACLILHATASGSGIHIATSALPEHSPIPHNPIPWNLAQIPSIPQSLRLANELGLALRDAKLPVLLTQGSIRPIDNLTCPAVAIELAPLATGTPSPVTDAAYQQQTAQAIASALSSYRTHNAPPPTNSPSVTSPGAPR